MADVEFHEEMVPSGGAPTSVGNTARARGQISESITVGTGGFSPTRDEPAGRVEQESIMLGRRGGVALSERAQKMLANIDKHGTVSDDAPAVTVTDDSPPAAEDPAAAVAPAQEQTPPVQSPPAAAAAPSPTAPATSTEDAIAERASRLETRNRELLTELEQLKAKPARGEPSAREKALDEAERSILEDSVGAIRKVYMTALGVDDPKHPQVDKFMTWLYHDLTEHELNVPLDASIKALRESERNLALRARDKREMAEAAKPAPVQADNGTAAKVGIVSNLLSAQADHATKYPLLRNLSTDFDGMKPEELLWRELDRGFQTGEYDRNAQDTALIDLASRKIESHYQALADKIAKARPSTATPTQAAAAKDSKADPQAPGVRTITNASASVAPATTPAAKPAPTETTPKKPWRNEKERIRMLAAKHAGESG